MSLLLLLAAAHAGAPITVVVSGAANDDGRVMCQLFRSAEGFPSDDPKASAYAVSTISHGRATCTFPDQAPGTVAISAYHDEDSDAKLQTNLLGLPTEGYGFSNGAQAGYFGPPSFEAAAVVVGAAPLTLSLALTR